jgi:hypothetical protein
MTIELLSAAEIAVHSGREGVVYQVKDGDGTLYKWNPQTKAMQAVGAGEGLPVGGTTGQVLAKASDTDSDVEWVNAGAGDLLAANNLSDVASASTARSNLGLAIGSDVQAYSANLAEYAAVNPTAAGLALLDDADAAAQRTTMGAAAAASPSFTGVETHGGTNLFTAAAMAALEVDITKARNTKTLAATTATLTYSGTPSDGQEFGLELTGHTAACVVTMPASTIDADRKTPLSTFVMPADVKAFLGFRRVGSSTYVTGVPTPNVSVFNTNSLAGDDSYEGEVIAGLNAGATIAQWEAVYLGSSSTWLLADANGSSTYPARGLAVAAYVDTNAATILRRGTARNDAWNWTPGGDIYLSTTAGGLTQTAPSTASDKVQKVGFALTADIAFFDFASGEYLTAA